MIKNRQERPFRITMIAWVRKVHFGRLCFGVRAVCLCFIAVFTHILVNNQYIFRKSFSVLKLIIDGLLSLSLEDLSIFWSPFLRIFKYPLFLLFLPYGSILGRSLFLLAPHCHFLVIHSIYRFLRWCSGLVGEYCLKLWNVNQVRSEKATGYETMIISSVFSPLIAIF